MRVIAGEAKGRRLRTLASRDLRPTSDRVREALFSTLGPRVAGGRVLDLYAGSGSLGIEALSRGAARATFVERHRAAAEVIRKNLEATGLAGRAEVVEETVERFLARRSRRRFDLVLIDPPWALGLPSGVFSLLRGGPHLAPGALLVLGASARNLPLPLPEGFALRDERRYGDSALLYLTREER